MKNIFQRFVLITATFLFLAACTGVKPAEPTVTATSTFEPPTATVEPTNTPEPTFTPFPTMTATVTLTPTSTVGWSSFTVTFSDQISSYGVFFNIPGLDDIYDVRIDNLRYSCYTDARYPNMLFCYGSKFREEVYVPVEFIPQGSEDPVYTSTLIVSSAMFVEALPECIPSTWCPDRGKQMNCETEDRTSWSPPCMVSTCVDLCGFCVGYNTCDLLGSFPPP